MWREKSAAPPYSPLFIPDSPGTDLLHTPPHATFYENLTISQIYCICCNLFFIFVRICCIKHPWNLNILKRFSLRFCSKNAAVWNRGLILCLGHRLFLDSTYQNTSKNNWRLLSSHSGHLPYELMILPTKLIFINNISWLICHSPREEQFNNEHADPL